MDDQQHKTPVKSTCARKLVISNCLLFYFCKTFPNGASLVAQRVSVCLQWGSPMFDPWVGKIPRRGKWQPTPVFLLGESHGQRSLVGYSSRGRRESDRTEWLHLLFLSFPNGKVKELTGGHSFLLLDPSASQCSCSVVSASLWPHGLQHARLPCPSPTPGACSNSCLDTISSVQSLSRYHRSCLFVSLAESFSFSWVLVQCLQLKVGDLLHSFNKYLSKPTLCQVLFGTYQYPNFLELAFNSFKRQPNKGRFGEVICYFIQYLIE